MRACSIALLFAACIGNEGPPPPPVLTPTPPAAKKVDTGTPPPPNRPPRVGAITFSPAAPTASESVRVSVETEDPDKDRLDIDYLWFINGERQLTRTRDSLPFLDFKKGDILAVEVSVSDGTTTVQRNSADITVVNSAPVFTTDPRRLRSLDGAVIEADDPDGDPLTYTLKGAPDGMTIDPKSGALSYVGTQDEPGGAYAIRVIANDGDQGRAEWAFKVDISPGSKAPKAAPDGG